MAALGHVDQMPQGCPIGGNKVHVGGEARAFATDHRTGHRMAVEADTKCFKMQCGPIVLVGMSAAGLEQLVHIGGYDGRPGQLQANGEMRRAETPAGGRHDNFIHLGAGHLLGLGDGGTDRVFDGVGVDDHAGLEAACALMTQSDDPGCAAGLAQQYGARHLRRADIEQADDLVRGVRS